MDKIHPLSRREYERMVELGFFDEDERVELHRSAYARLLRDGDVLRPTRLPGIAIPISELPR